jgi:hypothetical protein
LVELMQEHLLILEGIIDAAAAKFLPQAEAPASGG